ncbi:MAG: hypothetical protein JW934_22885 [Anaerolineae bacterium]|nr:hypothetical protein [Anaerolineae bacterium]
MLRRFICTLVLISILCAAGPSMALAQSLAEWTVLIYLDGDNNLEREAIDDFLEMAAVGSSATVNVLVQFDRLPGYDARYGDWSGTLRFRVAQGMTPEPHNALVDLGEANMGDPQTLADFVSWGMAAFPARRTALILWNHGDGWRASSLAKAGRKAICWDDTSGRDALDAAELRDVLSMVTSDGAAPLDMLAFDACLMAMIEIDTQIAPYVRVRVGSQDTEPGTGYPYDAILRDLIHHADWNGAALGTMIVERYYQAYGGETQSAVRLDADYAALIDAVDQLALALLDHQAAETEVIRAARRQVRSFEVSYVDLSDLARLIAASTTVALLRSAAQAVIDAADRVTLANRYGASLVGANGISIYFPAQPAQWDDLYAGDSGYLAFTVQTHWDEFLQAYLAAVWSCAPDAYEPDDAWDAVSPAVIDGQPQRRNFCPASDLADWIAFEVDAGRTVEITTSELGFNCDTALRLYDADGTALLVEDDDGGAGRASRLVWTSSTTTTLHLQVIEYYRRTGPDTDYTLNIALTDATVTVVGQVGLQGRTSSEGVQIQAQPGDQKTASAANGAFGLDVSLPCTITASFDGYLPVRWVLTEVVASILVLDPVTLWGGDLNADGQIDILDIAFVGARFGSTDSLADLTADGVVDIRDLVLPAGNFGRAAYSDVESPAE